MASIHWTFVLNFAFSRILSHYIFLNKQNGFQSIFTSLHFHDNTIMKN